jgi:hypothetical protein
LLEKKRATIRFQPVKLIASPSGAPVPSTTDLELLLRDGRRVAVRRGFDAAALADLVRTVESWSC